MDKYFLEGKGIGEPPAGTGVRGRHPSLLRNREEGRSCRRRGRGGR